jgi:hypothetical protein
MSDGTTRTERDRELNKIERNSVTIEGKKIFIKPALRPQNQTPPEIDKNKELTNGGLRSSSASVVQDNVEDSSGWIQGPDGVWRAARYSAGVGR